MSKLLKLLEWVPVPKAAKYLAAIFEEEVTEADIFHLALEKRLTLSVNFVNGVEARKCNLLPLSEAKLADGIPVPGREPYKVVLGLAMPDGKHVLDVEQEVVSVSGVWDLPLIGAEALDVEDRYHLLTGGPRVEGLFLDGAFIQHADDLYQVQTHLEQSGLFKKEDLSKPWSNPANFVPAAGLPDDVVFVVRVAELARFQAALSEDDKTQRGKDAQVHPRSETTYLNIIGALLELVRSHRSGRDSDAAVIREMVDNYEHLPGIAKSTLEAKFSDARRSMASTPAP